jgi:cysteine synthase
MGRIHQSIVETVGNTPVVRINHLAPKMAEPFSVERRKLMRFLGAKVIVTPAAERAVGMVNKAIELAKAHSWFMTRQFENEANPDIHTQTTAREILDDQAAIARDVRRQHRRQSSLQAVA